MKRLRMFLARLASSVLRSQAKSVRLSERELVRAKTREMREAMGMAPHEGLQ